MDTLRLGRSVRRVVKLQSHQDGGLVPVVIYKAGSRKKKSSSALRPFEKVARKLARSQVDMSSTYLRKHDRSNQKRRDGWMKDFISNFANAERKGRKRLVKSYRGLPMPLRMN